MSAKSKTVNLGGIFPLKLKYNIISQILLLGIGQEKCVKFIEISCSADVNITKKVEENLNSYGPLIRNLQIMYAH